MNVDESTSYTAHPEPCPVTISNFLNYRFTNSTVVHSATTLTSEPNATAETAITPDESLLGNPINGEKVIMWSNLSHIYSLLNAYGGPSCVLPTELYLVIGTKRGDLLIFDYKEFLQLILVPQTIAEGTPSLSSASTTANDDFRNHEFRSPTQLVAISSDGTHLAASYESGDVFLWDLNSTSAAAAAAATGNGTGERNLDSVRRSFHALYAILRITDHQGLSVNGLTFKDFRHTAVLVSDPNGSLSLHDGHRSRLWTLTYSTKQLLSLPPDEILLAMKPEPIVGTQDTTGGKGQLLGVLTSKNMYIATSSGGSSGRLPFSRTSQSVCTVLFKSPVDLSKCQFFGDHSSRNIIVPNNDISWFVTSAPEASTANVAFSINNTVTVFVFRIFGDHQLQLTQTEYKSDFLESIISIKWLSNDLLSVLLVSHQLLVLQPFNNFRTVMKLDLLPHDIIIPPNKFVKFFNNRFLILTRYSIKIGKFISWSPLILNKVQKGNYLRALNLLYQFAESDFPIPVQLNLMRDPKERIEQLMDPFNNLVFASLRYILKREKDNPEFFETELQKLLLLVVNIQKRWYKDQPEFDQVFLRFLAQIEDTLLIESSEFVKMEFTKLILRLILNDSINVVTPSVFQEILNYIFTDTDTIKSLEPMILKLNPNSWDVDLLVRKIQHNDIDSSSYQFLLIYIWNFKFGDFLTPLVDFIKCIRDGNASKCELFTTVGENGLFSTDTVYTYLAFLYTGKYYPSGKSIPSNIVDRIRRKVSFLLFSAVSIYWPLESDSKLFTTENVDDESPFPYFNLLLNHNPKKFLSMLNEIMEDPYFDQVDPHRGDNIGEEDTESTLFVSRQYIADILVEILRGNSQESSPENLFLIATFLATNVPKYPQFIHISSKFADLIVSRILEFKGTDPPIDARVIDTTAQEAIESILSVYKPADPKLFALQLSERHFYVALAEFYHKSKDYGSMLSLFLLQKDDGTINGEGSIYNTETVLELISQHLPSDRSTEQLRKYSSLIEAHFEYILSVLGPKKLVKYLSLLNPKLHENILKISDNKLKQEYLEILFTSGSVQNICILRSLRKPYIELSCQQKHGDQLLSWLDGLDFKNIPISLANNVIGLLENGHDYRALATVHYKLNDSEALVDDTTRYIESWFSSAGPETTQSEAHLLNVIDLSIKLSGTVQRHDMRLSHWVHIITSLVKQYNAPSDANDLPVDTKRHVIGEILQHVFLKLSLMENKCQLPLSDTNSSLEKKFWKILAGVLENQDVILMKVGDIRELLQKIFVSYNLEEQMSFLVLKILEQSSQDIVHTYQHLLAKGWAVSNVECEVCGKKLRGPDVDPSLLDAWVLRCKGGQVPEEMLAEKELVAFECSHCFHSKCLRNLGQAEDGTYKCLLSTNGT